MGMNTMAGERLLFAGSPGKQDRPADRRTALQLPAQHGWAVGDFKVKRLAEDR